MRGAGWGGGPGWGGGRSRGGVAGYGIGRSCGGAWRGSRIGRACNRHTDHAVGDLLGLRPVMGDEQDGHATGLECAQQFMDACLGVDI